MVRRFELKDLHVICTDALSNPLFRMPKEPNPTGPNTGDQCSCIGFTGLLLDGTKTCPEEKEKWWLDRACRSSTRSSSPLDPVNDDSLIFRLLALQRIGRHQVAYSESPGTQRVVSQEWSTCMGPFRVKPQPPSPFSPCMSGNRLRLQSCTSATLHS